MTKHRKGLFPTPVRPFAGVSSSAALWPRLALRGLVEDGPTLPATVARLALEHAVAHVCIVDKTPEVGHPESLPSCVSCFNFALERQTENLLGLADAAQDEIPE